MTNSTIVRSIALGLAGCTSGFMAGAANAALSQAVIVPPGGFIQAGAYQALGTNPSTPGQDLTLSHGMGQSFQEFTFSGASSAAATASASGPTPLGLVTNSANGTVEMGRARMTASNTSPNGANGAAGLTNGGWKETFTVNHPSLNGQEGFLVFRVHARGTLTVSGEINGLSGSASLIIAAYKDNIDLRNNPLYDPGNSDPTGSENQRGIWGLGQALPSATRTVDGMVTMAVPITFGQGFTLGVYARATANQGNQTFGQYSVYSNSATLDFSGSGVTWGGITSVQSGGAPVTGYTIISGSGINWRLPFGACVADFDDGSGTGTPDGGVTIDDLLYYLGIFDAGAVAADVDDGSGTGTQDGGVTIDDLLFYLARFDAGC